MNENIQKIKEKKSLEGLSIGLIAGGFLYQILSIFINNPEVIITVISIISVAIFLYERSINEFEQKDE